MRVVIICYLGMLLFTPASLFSESMRISFNKNILLQGLCAVLLTSYFFALDTNLLHTAIFIRFGLHVIALHLLISFVPYKYDDKTTNLWQYNQILFQRICTGIAYPLILFLGIALAITAVDQLFNIHIDGKIYLDLFLIIAGIFNTYFFLAGVPKNFDTVDYLDNYHKGLKILTRYILLPLISLYLLILYAYEIKLFLKPNWPIESVIYLVFIFNIVGILLFLLTWGIRNEKENNLEKIFTRLFYWVSLPTSPILLLSIYRRILQYGITECRYFIFVLSFWLIFIGTYFLISKVKNIKLIPISLCFITLCASFGPWGAFRVFLNKIN